MSSTRKKNPRFLCHAKQRTLYDSAPRDDIVEQYSPIEVALKLGIPVGTVILYTTESLRKPIRTSEDKIITESKLKVLGSLGITRIHDPVNWYVDDEPDCYNCTLHPLDEQGLPYITINERQIPIICYINDMMMKHGGQVPVPSSWYTPLNLKLEFYPNCDNPRCINIYHYTFWQP